MNRRFFLKNTLSVSILSSLAIDGWLKCCILRPNEGRDVRSLVLVQLEGGNDGLSTVIPLDQYANLTKARKNIIIPDKKALPLHDSSVTGLHPALGEIQKLYNNKQLTILQGVGCPNPDLSHFKAIDIWHTAYDLPSTIPTGWVGRFLEQESMERSADSGHPMAVQVGPSLSKALLGSSSSGMIVRNTDFFYDLIPGNHDPAPKTKAGDQLSFLRRTIEESKGYLLKVKEAAMRQKNLSKMYPAGNALADQLKIVAQLIGGGLQTKVYVVNIKGFDTHDDQVDISDTTQGPHADLLSQVSRAIGAFEDDLALMGKEDMVLGMVYSEFGRRIKSNASWGCDHGTSAPVLLFGSKLKGGLVGHNPIIADKVEVNDNLPMQIDFRSVYASILKDWLGVSKPAIESSLMSTYPTLDLFNS